MLENHMASYGEPFSPEHARLSHDDARHQVLMPAIGLMVTAGIDILLFLLDGLVRIINSYRVANGSAPFGVTPDNLNDPGFKTGYIIGMVAFGALDVLLVVCAVVQIYGAIKMKNLQSFGLAMTSCVLGVIPCISCCFLVGMPFGIWGLVTLNKPEVRSAFQ
jgi:hypothetical protein